MNKYVNVHTGSTQEHGANTSHTFSFKSRIFMENPFNPNKLLPTPLKPRTIDTIFASPEQNPSTYEPPKPKLENENILEKELSLEQKKRLGGVWTKMIVDDENIPENIGEMNESEIKKWLFESVMKDIAKFVEELGIKIDTELISKIQNTKDADEKSALELKYIKNVHVQMYGIVSTFDKSPDRSTKWDSWPKRMRETGEFNCVGATLVGTHLLKSAGIEPYYGNPKGHVLNIVSLQNGEWWYADFRNGKGGLIKIDPAETTIEGARVLKIKHPHIDYKLIPIYNSEDLVEPILGNLSSIKRTAEKPKDSDESLGKKEAREFYEKYQEDFQKTDFALLNRSLYPKIVKVSSSEEMREEEARIRKKRDLSEPIQAYLKTLDREVVKAATLEMKDKKDIIAEVLSGGGISMLSDFSPELGHILGLYLGGLERLKERDAEGYEEFLDDLVSKIKSL